MGRRSAYTTAIDCSAMNMTVELIGVPDGSEGAPARHDRVQTMLAKIILLGQKRGRPRKDSIDEAEIAA